MSKIIFNLDPSNVYEGQFSQIGNNQIRLVMNSLPSESILLSGFCLINEHNGRIQTNRKDYVYIYRNYEDGKTIELCNDNIQWEKPKAKVRFVNSFGGTLDGKLEQIIENYEELVIPTPVANENYEFIKWSPEIPTSGVVEKDVTFTALFEHVETLEEVRNAKITEFNTICSETIIAGQDITLSDGNTIHFSYTAFDQTNLGNGANLALSTKESVPYYDSNNNCYIFKPMDMVTIYASCQGYVTYLLTLDHHLEAMIKKMDDKDAIKVLVFAEESMDAETKTEFDAIMTQAQAVADKYMANAIATLGIE